jgi:hypothetical protein
MLELRNGTMKIDKSITHTDLHKPNNKFVQLEHFGARTSHKHTQTDKTHHGLDLQETTTFPLIVYYVSSHGSNTQMSFCPKTEIPTFGTPTTLGAHNFVCRPLIEMRS